jgi:lysophospholipase L1-like esterase
MKTICLAWLSLLLLVPSSSPAGEAYLAWSDSASGNPAIHLSRTSSGDVWEAIAFSGGEGFAANYLPCVAIDGSGRPGVVWAAQKGDEEARIYFSRQEDSGFTPPRRVSAAAGWESNPAIAFDDKGVPWVAFSRLAGESSEIFCSRFDGQGFSGETMVSGPDDSPDAKPALGTDGSGALVVAWQGWDGSRTRIFERRCADGVWGETMIVSPPEANGLLPWIVRGADGKAHALWSGTETAVGGLPDSPPLPSSELAERGAWLARKNDSGHWEIVRWNCPQEPSAEDSPASVTAVTAHTYTGYGDSVTYGTGAKDACYIPLLKTMLEQAYPGNTYTIWNAGYPNTRTYNLLSGGVYQFYCPGIDVILARFPSTMIFIMGGTNDIVDGDNYNDIKWNLGEMINRARARGVEPILATIIPRFDLEIYRQRSRTLSVSYIRPLASAKGVRLADPWQKMIDYGRYESLYVSDKIHPRYPAGDQKIADAWFPAVPAGPISPLDHILQWSRDWATGL